MNFNWLKNKKFTVIAAVLSTMLAAGTLADVQMFQNQTLTPWKNV